MRRVVVAVLVLGSTLGLTGCRRAPSRGRVLALGLAVFSKDAAGRQVPGHATAAFLAPGGKAWRHGTLTDPESNVFHKLLEYCPASGDCGLLSVGGSAAALKLWRPGAEPQVLWQADFGGRFSRMRDAEVADVLGDGVPTIVVGTHDQGVVAVVRPDGRAASGERARPRAGHLRARDRGRRSRRRRRARGLRHAEPARTCSTARRSPASVVRYVPARGEGRTVVADLGDRHAKEILVADIDGDGRDELYVSVEAVTGGTVEIRRFRRRYRARSGERRRSPRWPDALCRFLTAGDVDGDGRTRDRGRDREERPVAPAPAARPAQRLVDRASIARDSSGFEHAASSPISTATGATSSTWPTTAGEVRRYLWRDGAWDKDVLYRYEGKMPGFTWNVTAVPAAVVPPSAWE